MVDDEVVKQVSAELHNDDWRALVLHLWALDHVGHIGGPKSGAWARVRLLRDNALQLLRVYMAQRPTFSVDSGSEDDDGRLSDCGGGALPSSSPSDRRFACLWKRAEDSLNSDRETALDGLYESCRHAQRTMSVPRGEADLRYLLYGAAAAGTCMLLSFLAYRHEASTLTVTIDRFATAAVGIGYELTMLDIHLIESEHLFWYCASLGYLTCIVVLSLSWNEVGEHRSEAARAIQGFLGANTGSLWLLVVAAFFSTGSHPLDGKRPTSVLSISRLPSHVLSLAAPIFKFASTYAQSPELVASAPEWVKDAVAEVDLTFASRVLFTGLASALIVELFRPRKSTSSRKGTSSVTERLSSTLDVVTLYLMTQSRATNIPLFLLFRLQLASSLTTTTLTLIAHLLARSAYGALGHTNSVAAIDIPNGFNGTSARSTSPLIPAQISVAMWACGAWWFGGGLRALLLSRTEPEGEQDSRSSNNHNGSATKGATKKNMKMNKKKPRSAGVFTSYAVLATFLEAAGASLLHGGSLSVLLLLGDDDAALWTRVVPTSLLTVMRLFIHLGVNLGFCGLLWWLA
ncbi:Uu.00g089020.m01.CDS01 [Anthostomella pinea]|uniref:GPI ethanolamine phosphate transferase 2 n=1 Tax=Anthostomella pinea TaxID=933095 RepID=A0AAI8VMJ6_9PEZI|nr:Uu.00g089020.m01.CDS01 [Anthostomella pinea]